MARPIPKKILNLFNYENGHLYYKELTTGRGKNNGRAGTTDRGGYVRIKVGDSRWPAHRIIWEMFYGTIPDGMMIDHINRHKWDNRIENLRIVDNQHNQFNNNAKNISWCRQTSSWKVCVTMDGKHFGTKRFPCFGEASKYRNKLRELRFNG